MIKSNLIRIKFDNCEVKNMINRKNKMNLMRVKRAGMNHPVAVWNFQDTFFIVREDLKYYSALIFAQPSLELYLSLFSQNNRAPPCRVEVGF